MQPESERHPSFEKLLLVKYGHGQRGRRVSKQAQITYLVIISSKICLLYRGLNTRAQRDQRWSKLSKYAIKCVH